MQSNSFKFIIVPLSALFLVTILIVMSQNIEAQPTKNFTAVGYGCSESPVQPADPVVMFEHGPDIIYVQKETFDCSYSIPTNFKKPFNQDVSIVLELPNIESGPNLSSYFGSFICSRSNEGNITGCDVTSPAKHPPGNMTQCVERSIEHPLESLTTDDIGTQGPIVYYSDTHVYKCLGQDQFPRIKIVTFFSTYVNLFETVCVENETTPIALSKVESCNLRVIW